MAFTPLQELRSSLVAGTAVFIVGMEVSHHAVNDARLTWPGLLEDGFEYCRARDFQPAAASTKKRFGAKRWQFDADTIERSVGQAEEAPRGLEGWLSAAFRNIRIARYDGNEAGDQPASLIGALWEFGFPVVTTNFDLLFEEALLLRPVTWLEPSRVRTALRGEREDTIVHLHGVCDDGESIVLSESKGDQQLRDEPLQLALFAADYASCIVCVGFYGPLDPAYLKVEKLLKGLARWPTSHHFLLVKSEEVRAFRSSLADAHIRRVTVVSYGEHIGELETFLRDELRSTMTNASRNAVGLEPVRRGVQIARRLETGHRPLRINDAAVLLQKDLESCARLVGKLNSPLRHLADRLHQPPDWDSWTLEDREEFHEFYAAAAKLAADRLGRAVSQLELAIRAVHGRAETFRAAVDQARHGTVPRVIRVLGHDLAASRDIAWATWAEIQIRLDELLDESDEWRSVANALPHPRESVDDPLDELGEMLELISIPPKQAKPQSS